MNCIYVLIDERRRVIIPGSDQETIRYSAENWIALAQEAIENHNYFAVALSGGSTPKAIYSYLNTKGKNALDWSKVLLFWSDERCVAPNDQQSNFRMAMEALKDLNIPEKHIFRMKGEGNPEENAKEYETLIQTRIPTQCFDLMMLGMGEDGHTASLFPETHGLQAKGRLVVANFLPAKDIWRLSVTFECINAAQRTEVYITGASKAAIVKKVFTSSYIPDELPIQKVGSAAHPAIFIIDRSAASNTFTLFPNLPCMS